MDVLLQMWMLQLWNQYASNSKERLTSELHKGLLSSDICCTAQSISKHSNYSGYVHVNFCCKDINWRYRETEWIELHWFVWYEEWIQVVNRSTHSLIDQLSCTTLYRGVLRHQLAKCYQSIQSSPLHCFIMMTHMEIWRWRWMGSCKLHRGLIPKLTQSELFTE